ncbi:MAG: cytochrome c family protein [Pseudomonadota bacterium]
MDFMTLNKVAAAFLGALLMFLLFGFFSEQAVRGTKHHDEVLAYALDIGALSGGEEDVAEEVVEEIDYSAMLASADIDNGKSIFRACAACHKVQDGANAVGPHLWGVVGRGIGAVDGFNYSGALADKGGEWNFENLAGFLANPKEWAPGTRMSYSGLKDPKDRVDLISWLNVEGDSNITLTAPAPAAVEAAADEAPADEDAAATQ